MRTVAIVGVGLIGGSFGLALKKAGFTGEVIGVSSDAALGAARDAGAIDSSATLAEAVARADLIYLAQEIGRILDTLRHLKPLPPTTLVTDAGSTKVSIVAAACSTIPQGQFLGGHPMAGKETRGASAADPDLFAGRPYVLTPRDPHDLDTTAAQEFVGWLRRIGARVSILEPATHDRIVAYTSHLAQLASTALAATVGEHLTPDETAVSGPGLADTTRLALSSYDLWRDILATNAAPIDRALSDYIQMLEHVRLNLRTRELEAEFQAAARLAGKLRPASL